MEEIVIARVAVSAATYAFDKPYDYLVPAALRAKAAPGVRVTVPFGRGNKGSEAIILSVRTVTGKAGGFGLRNYWARTLFNILRSWRR